MLQNPPLKSSGQRAETWIEAARISSGAVVFAFCAGRHSQGTLPSQNSLRNIPTATRKPSRGFPMPGAPRHPRRARNTTSARMISTHGHDRVHHELQKNKIPWNRHFSDLVEQTSTRGDRRRAFRFHPPEVSDAFQILGSTKGLPWRSAISRTCILQSCRNL